jgi:hypothetical protein
MKEERKEASKQDRKKERKKEKKKRKKKERKKRRKKERKKERKKKSCFVFTLLPNLFPNKTEYGFPLPCSSPFPVTHNVALWSSRLPFLPCHFHAMQNTLPVPFSRKTRPKITDALIGK